MRIENLVTEIQSHPRVTERRQSTNNRTESTRHGDEVQLSQAGKALADFRVEDTSRARIEAIQQRVESGYYDQPQIKAIIAENMLSAGSLDAVIAEVQDIKITLKQLAEIPDVRIEKVQEAIGKLASGAYNDKNVLKGTADGLMGMLLG
ncbi:MAG: flagellar biosynthesis anti-sigma factor FlgM [bacterium]|nr:flagellar biosynthesis anti-sigma factor FlgM [bacterium]